ncbi:MAG: FkbM family methyltransferase [Promethearchaeota archaeon]|jgi:pyruvate dehydrogenase E1 component alpha subunit
MGKIKSKALLQETKNFYKTMTDASGNETDLYVSYSVFNVNWMDELGIDPKIIFDVGCNNGGDSIRFKRQWEKAQVHAFEADSNFEKEIENYMKEERIIFVNSGVLDEDAEHDFYPSRIPTTLKSSGSGTFIKSRAESNDPRVEFLKPEKIKTISLHTYCKKNEIKEIDLLHIDAEGSELKVIKGLKDIRPKVIFAEQSPLILTDKEIVNFHTYLTKYNYVLVGKYECNYLYVDRKEIDYIPKHLKKVRKVTITKKELIDFENKIAEEYDNEKIKAAIHLSKGNEDSLIEIFQYIRPNDWVFSAWRNHYHALLHGIPKNKLFKDIVDGKSMSTNGRYFYSSSIVGGIIPIAVGTALALKLKKSKRKVWCFIGDMTYETGIFHESYKYVKNFDLPLQFVVEDNNMSVHTPTVEAWGKKQDIPEDVIFYKYLMKYPHHGTGKWLNF